jgi:hypothetical protein
MVSSLSILPFHCFSAFGRFESRPSRADCGERRHSHLSSLPSTLSLSAIANCCPSLSSQHDEILSPLFLSCSLRLSLSHFHTNTQRARLSNLALVFALRSHEHKITNTQTQTHSHIVTLPEVHYRISRQLVVPIGIVLRIQKQWPVSCSTSPSFASFSLRVSFRFRLLYFNNYK